MAPLEAFQAVKQLYIQGKLHLVKTATDVHRKIMNKSHYLRQQLCHK